MKASSLVVRIDRSKCLNKTSLECVGHLLLDESVAQELKAAIEAGKVVSIVYCGPCAAHLAISDPADAPPVTTKPECTCGEKGRPEKEAATVSSGKFAQTVTDGRWEEGSGRAANGPQEAAEEHDPGFEGGLAGGIKRILDELAALRAQIQHQQVEPNLSGAWAAPIAKPARVCEQVFMVTQDGGGVTDLQSALDGGGEIVDRTPVGGAVLVAVVKRKPCNA